MSAPTEQDRVVARRVLRRRAHASKYTRIETLGRRLSPCNHERAPLLQRDTETGAWRVFVGVDVMAAAVDGARLGREYAATLRSAS